MRQTTGIRGRQHPQAPHRRHTTKRICTRCGLVKLTRKEPPEYWTEFVRNGEHVNSERTPSCIAVEKAA